MMLNHVKMKAVGDDFTMTMVVDADVVTMMVAADGDVVMVMMMILLRSTETFGPVLLALASVEILILFCMCALAGRVINTPGHRRDAPVPNGDAVQVWITVVVIAWYIGYFQTLGTMECISIAHQCVKLFCIEKIPQSSFCRD